MPPRFGADDKDESTVAADWVGAMLEGGLPAVMATASRIASHSCSYTTDAIWSLKVDGGTSYVVSIREEGEERDDEVMMD